MKDIIPVEVKVGEGVIKEEAVREQAVRVELENG
jgi:hypothetical protein